MNTNPPSEEIESVAANTAKGPMGLLPCPFCGSEAVAGEYTGHVHMVYYVRCDGPNCPIENLEAIEDSFELAATAWNKRIAPSDPKQPESSDGTGVSSPESSSASAGTDGSSTAEEALKRCETCGTLSFRSVNHRCTPEVAALSQQLKLAIEALTEIGKPELRQGDAIWMRDTALDCLEKLSTPSPVAANTNKTHIVPT